MKLLLPLLGCLAFTLALTEGTMVCYFESWAVYRPGKGKFDVEDVDPFLCTHLIFGFAGLGSNNEIAVLDPWHELCDDYGECAFQRFNALKEINPDLITILAVGGWNEGSAKYSDMAKDAAKRQTFVNSAIALLKEHGFDGLDMDWEYPTQRGGAPEDRENFVLLLSDLKTALHANGMMLTAAVSAGKPTIDEAYDIPAMAEHLDMVNLMTYDFHGDWEDYTHHQSGLYMHPQDTGGNQYFNQDFAVRYWIDNGMPANKINQGVPMYGRCWKLDDPEQTGYYAPASQPSQAGPYTEEQGYWGFNEICEKGLLGDWIVVHDQDMHEPYAYSIPDQRIWCSYDDHDSVKLKAEYAKEHGLAGMMAWAIDTDDFLGMCGRPFGLITNMVETFTGIPITPPPTPEPTTRDPDATTIPPSTRPPTPPPSEVCQQPGINGDNENCHHYWNCYPNAEGGYDADSEECDEGLLFNANTYICDWADNVCATEGMCPNDCPP